LINTTVLCKAQGCGAHYPAMFTACPSCGSGSMAIQRMPNEAPIGGGAGPVVLEKSVGGSSLKPARRDPDVRIG
jgi:hypothetical protein